MQRRFPIGAEIVPDGVHFRVWAPDRKQLAVALEDGPEAPLQPEPSGYFSGLVEASAGMRYRFRVGEQTLVPDPASRFQPEGPHGPSEIVDPGTFRWSDGEWRGVGSDGQVIYEMHVGTFTPEGSWTAAARELLELARLGITIIEVMPVAEFPGRFGWGYDGVDLFAPTRLYGRPDDFRRFVDEAHGAGIGVILDVVYNHLGPDGNYLDCFSSDYVTDRYPNEWGRAINFDGPGSAAVREFFLTNARYWVEEFHLDGLRLDATQQIFDASSEHILAALSRAVRAAARGRGTFLVGENEPQHVRLMQPIESGGYGLDALWNDDFHHSARVALTGRSEAYYTDYRGTAQELASAVKWGFLYQGQRYKWQKKRRGTPTFGIERSRFVTFIQNHDQVANSGRGERIDRLTSPGRLRAATALLLLGPGTPMLFQGQEFAASSPFLYFADHKPELARAVAEGRDEFLAQFPGLATPDMKSCLAPPGDSATFTRSKLDLGERERHDTIYRLHRDLLALRRGDPVIARPHVLDTAVLSDEAFVIRYFGENGDDRLLLVNLGRDLHLDPAPEPLLGPPADGEWGLLWSSEAPAYGGCGTAEPDTEENWRIPGHATLVLKAIRR